MGRPLIGYPNRADAATLSGGSWLAALPATNVQDADFSVVARSTDATAASTRIDLDLGAAYSIKVVAVHLPNASRSATVRVYADDASDYSSVDYDPGAENVYDTTFFPASTTFYGEDVSSSALPAELWNEGYRLAYIHIPATVQAYRYWRIDIADTGNTDGYVDVGRVFIGSAYRPSTNFSTGSEMGFDTMSKSVRTQGGRKRAVDLPKWRVFRGTLPKLTTDEATIQAIDLFRRLGTSEQFFFVQDDSDTYLLQRRSYWATFSELPLMQIPVEFWDDFPVQIEEVL